MGELFHNEQVDEKVDEKEKDALECITSLKFSDFMTIGARRGKFPINFMELKKMCETGNVLEDAHIFKYLFGFEVAGKCFKKSEEGFDFNAYNITFEDWNIFMKFIKFGVVGKNIHRLMEICNKFGGIPAFDRRYRIDLDKDKKKDHNADYNPMKPKEDVRKLYIWSVCDSSSALASFHVNNPGFSVAGYDKRTEYTYTYYWRKLKTHSTKSQETPVVRNRTLHHQERQDMDDMHDFREDTILENFE